MLHYPTSHPSLLSFTLFTLFTPFTPFTSFTPFPPYCISPLYTSTHFPSRPHTSPHCPLSHTYLQCRYVITPGGLGGRRPESLEMKKNVPTRMRPRTSSIETPRGTLVVPDSPGGKTRRLPTSEPSSPTVGAGSGGGEGGSDAAQKTKVFRIFDARSYVAATANRVGKGKGAEQISNYSNASIEMCDIGNIHTMRSSLSMLERGLTPVASIGSDGEWLNTLHKSGWLKSVRVCDGRMGGERGVWVEGVGGACERCCEHGEGLGKRGIGEHIKTPLRMGQ